MTESLSFSIGSKGRLPDLAIGNRKVKSYKPATEFANSMDNTRRKLPSVMYAKRKMHDEPVDIDYDNSEEGEDSNLKESKPKSKSNQNRNQNARRRKGRSNKNKNNRFGGNGNSNFKRPSRTGQNKINSSNSNGNGVKNMLMQSGRDKVTWNSDVNSGIVVNPFQNTTDHFTPLYILNGEFFPAKGMYGDNYYQNILRRFIFQKYLNCLASVNQRFTDNFKFNTFNDYIYVLTESLQLYYMVDSIITYYNSDNVNPGINYIHRKLNADILIGHHELGKILSTFAIPKNLLYFIRYMYQNFTIGERKESPIIRLGFKAYLQDNGVIKCELNKGVYDTLLLQLETNTILSTQLIKARKYGYAPNLYIGELPKSTDIMDVDTQFMTFWHNANVAYLVNKQTNVEYSQSVSDKSSNLYYGTFTQEVDGTIYASSSITEVKKDMKYEDGNSLTANIVVTQHTGIWRPFNDFQTSEWEYEEQCSLCCYSNNQINSITDLSKRIASHVHAAPYLPNKSGAWELLKSGYSDANIVQYHSVINLQQAVDQAAVELLKI